MIPPYDTAEIAAAVSLRARGAEIAIDELIVLADLRLLEWRIVAVLPFGGRLTLNLPFSTPGGIVLPAEVANRFVEEAMRR